MICVNCSTEMSLEPARTEREEFWGAPCGYVVPAHYLCDACGYAENADTDRAELAGERVRERGER